MCVSNATPPASATHALRCAHSHTRWVRSRLDSLCLPECDSADEAAALRNIAVQLLFNGDPVSVWQRQRPQPGFVRCVCKRWHCRCNHA
jgi:hypothetical protein